MKESQIKLLGVLYSRWNKGISRSCMSVRDRFSWCQNSVRTQYVGDDNELPAHHWFCDPHTLFPESSSSSSTRHSAVPIRTAIFSEFLSRLCFRKKLFRNTEGRMLGCAPGVVAEKVGCVFLTVPTPHTFFLVLRRTV